MANTEKKEVVKITKFTKDALIKSRKYNIYQDAIQVLVKDGESLTAEELERRLKEFYKNDKLFKKGEK